MFYYIVQSLHAVHTLSYLLKLIFASLYRCKIKFTPFYYYYWLTTRIIQKKTYLFFFDSTLPIVPITGATKRMTRTKAIGT